MSTKIYDGLRLVDPQADIFDVTARIATAVREEFTELRKTIVAEQFAQAIDNPKNEGKTLSYPFLDAEEKWHEKQKIHLLHGKETP